MGSELRRTDIDALTDGVPPGGSLASVHAEIIPARTWVEVGFDGLEMYLDTDQEVRLLVRKVEPS